MAGGLISLAKILQSQTPVFNIWHLFYKCIKLEMKTVHSFGDHVMQKPHPGSTP